METELNSATINRETNLPTLRPRADRQRDNYAQGEEGYLAPEDASPGYWAAHDRAMLSKMWGRTKRPRNEKAPLRLISTCLLIALALTSALTADPLPSIGKEQKSGSVTLMHVETEEDVTVFIYSSSCDVRVAIVSVRFLNRFEHQTVRFNGCYGRPHRLTFVNKGDKFSAIHVQELTGYSSMTFLP